MRRGPRAYRAALTHPRRRSALRRQQPGDPARAAQAIIDAVQSAKPPFRLVLGRDASKRIEAELNTQMQELTARRQAAIDADYQAGE